MLLMIGAPEIIFITLIVLLLFGGKKIPELMKGLGKGMRSFQEGMKGVDENPQAEPQPTQTQPQAAPQAEQPQAATGLSTAPQATAAPEDGRVPSNDGK